MRGQEEGGVWDESQTSMLTRWMVLLFTELLKGREGQGPGGKG